MINPIYLMDETLAQLQTHYNSDPEFETVTLSEFLDEETLNRSFSEIAASSFQRDERPIMYRKMISDLPKTLEELLASDALQNIVSGITGRKMNIGSKELVKFKHRDYQILHDHILPSPGIDLIIDLTEDWDDEFGGYITYTDGDGDYITLSQKGGTLSLINRKDRYHRFVKYVNQYSKELTRCYLILTLE